MAANVVCPTDSEWAILKRFFQQCAGGAVVLSPEAQRHLRELTSHEPCNVKRLDDYDFGGDPNIAIDVVDGVPGGDFALDAIRRALSEPTADG